MPVSEGWSGTVELTCGFDGTFSPANRMYVDVREDLMAENYGIRCGTMASGGTVMEMVVNGTPYRVHTFTNIGQNTFTVEHGGWLDIFLVGGGGGGANNGGGGGGGYTTTVRNHLLAEGAHPIVVSAGGMGRPGGALGYGSGETGGTSSAFGFSAFGGARRSTIG